MMLFWLARLGDIPKQDTQSRFLAFSVLSAVEWSEDMSSKRLRIQFALTMLAVMFALWVFRLTGGHVVFDILLLIWLILPIAAFGLGFLFRKRTIAEAFFLLSVIYCAIYALICCFQTTPPAEAEGNFMYLLFDPLFLVAFSGLLVPALALYGRIKRASSRTKEEPGKIEDTESAQ